MNQPPSDDTDKTDGREERWERERRELVGQIDEEFEVTRDYTGRGKLSPAVRDAMARVPRHLFVPPGEEAFAYVDHALPIGYNQTISQPFLVALMTELLAPEPAHVMLEVGTGSGYQAAVLSLLIEQLYTIEVVPELAASAKERLQLLGYANVEVRAGDGALGWPEHAPFDGIIVTAAAPSMPPALSEQLKPGGRMVIPIGDGYSQDLQLIEKRADGALDRHSILSVAFVPLTGGTAGRNRT